MAPTPPTPIQIHNQTDTSIYLTNASHVFLDPVEIAPASAGPVGYIPSRSSRETLNLAFSHVDGRRNWLLNLSSKGRWTKGGWEAVYAREVVAPETAVKADGGEASSQTSTIRHKPHALRFYRIKNPKSGEQTLVVLSAPPVESWLSHLPNDMALGDVALPGTHQSTALYGWPVSQCQQPSSPLDVQLQEGLRFLDVRLAEKNGKLIAYHGILSQRANFEDLLALVKKFLATPESSSETVIMSIQQENAATPVFLSLLRGYIEASPLDWFLENRIPTLGEVRGKIVLFSRFGDGAGTEWEDLGGMGLHPSGWIDSVQSGFEVELPKKDDGKSGEGWTLGIQDWYNIGTFLSIPEKATAVATLLMTQSPLEEHVPLAFCSASSFPLACPVTVARGAGWPFWGMGFEGVNSRVGRWILERLSSEDIEEKERQSLRGWILFDFYRSEPGLVELVLGLNFLGGGGGVATAKKAC